MWLKRSDGPNKGRLTTDFTGCYGQVLGAAGVDVDQ